ncbi:MAG: TPM domain-containing protein [Clostridia bacterium]|nr:TPM domain-containing protein [Clostridia bacterium]
MKTRFCVVLTVLCLLFAAAIPVSAEKPVPLVDDYAELLSGKAQDRIETAISDASARTGCSFYMATYPIPLGIVEENSEYRYTGEDFLKEYGLSQKDNIVILIVSKQGDIYYYDMYTYGAANSKISDKEVNYILDHETVYDNLKGGKLADGACSFFAMSADAYVGRVGVSYWIIAIVALIIALVIGAFACVSVYASYKQKNKSVDYPLDRYATLELTAKQDQFTGSFVTKRVISTGNGSSGGGGGSFHGGGGGHRGGR